MLDRRPRNPIQLIDLPSPWVVALRSGAKLVVWAGGFSEYPNEYVFLNVIEAEPEQEARLDVPQRLPANVRRVEMVVARIPVALVESVQTGRRPTRRARARPSPGRSEE
jgi:hypothetical protein